VKRFLRFNGVGALGIGVQLSTVAAFTDLVHMNVAAATGIGVAAAVVHNFIWHREWTWADRRAEGRHLLLTFGSFALSNGAVSLVGNVALVSILVWWTGLDGVAANVVAIAACGVANYWLSDRVVFSPGARSRPVGCACRSPSCLSESRGVSQDSTVVRERVILAGSVCRWRRLATAQFTSTHGG
jgi:putative flippase GtrA